ncbi:hypothetical protein G7051_17875 [Dysgonomonas sp. HDW5B]|nr:hypothetical protein G7051_17875 [Dysgonomonas sp. HDW5B]
MATSNNSVKDKIKVYLDKRAEEDPLFAVTYVKENKNIDECFSYIMGEVLADYSLSSCKIKTRNFTQEGVNIHILFLMEGYCRLISIILMLYLCLYVL